MTSSVTVGVEVQESQLPAQYGETPADTYLDLDAMAAIGALYRAAGAVRNHFERSVLLSHGLTWTAWIVLWTVWNAGEIETGHTAAAAGISKSTLTGVVGTLEARQLVRRQPHPDDGRRVLLSLTADAGRLMTTLVPEFNREEVAVLSPLCSEDLSHLTRCLQRVTDRLESPLP